MVELTLWLMNYECERLSGEQDFSDLDINAAL